MFFQHTSEAAFYRKVSSKTSGAVESLCNVITFPNINLLVFVKNHNVVPFDTLILSEVVNGNKLLVSLE